jgi:hypothetical protein
MKIRTSSCLTASVSTAAFRIVLGRDSRGLVYRHRREIMTLRRLREDPFPSSVGLIPRGRVATVRDTLIDHNKRRVGGVRP